ncbi:MULTISPECIES: lysophospholipid acyltransferase family protein [Shewanella]|uniref:lysophospholipid acyltransferase family protein n=1 Tax=Shewanella TaxID=22 RepID=UPI001C659A81|nr:MULTISPECIES: lysophospholipid acyltransferase family protein [Shewanella]QYJ93739.1 lysophospholipid acyltransferase family protein [Shewanella spartinae]QYK12862.1 lysophospholipid acyltransferase family protein [Shewanella rhizosphaerae]
MFQSLCKAILKLSGWTIDGRLPEAPQYIAIVGPHTSNWDFIVGVLARGALGQKIHFLGKHQLFIPPWGWLFRAIGGTPVDRRKNNNLVDAAAQLFQQDPNFKLALAPEGTRSPVKRWKTGFYHIATKAQVPIVTVALDFAGKRVVIPEAISVTGDIDKEMAQILDFYRTIKGRHAKAIPDYHA